MSIGSRRDFIKTTAAVAAVGSMGVKRMTAATISEPVGLQLYSVRELLPKDFQGTLNKVAAAGYKEVEAAGYYDRTAAQFKKAMDEAGLRCVSTHHSLGVLSPRLDELIEYGHDLGLAYIVCPSPTRKDPKAKGALDLDDWKWVAGELNKIGAKVKAAGMTFGYHNHGPEFGAEAGVTYYDELLKLTDPELVVFEMDCGWVYAAGRDPLDYLTKTPERFPLLHIKDMEMGANGEMHSVVLGRGKIDYAPIFRAATGLKHYFIEQEDFDMDTMEALRLDAEYMKKLRV